MSLVKQYVMGTIGETKVIATESFEISLLRSFQILIYWTRSLRNIRIFLLKMSLGSVVLIKVFADTSCFIESYLRDKIYIEILIQWKRREILKTNSVYGGHYKHGTVENSRTLIFHQRLVSTKVCPRFVFQKL